MIISRFIQLLDLMIISRRIQALDHHVKKIVMIINDLHDTYLINLILK